jgi:glycosyltransferase involved in cell wall biosynthesis
MTVSEFTRGELAWEFPSHTAKLKVNYNFVDRDIFHPDEEMPTSINGRYILFVGNLKPHKNLAAAIEALKLLDDDGLRLAVVGADSGFIHGLGKDLKRLRSEDRVSFLGRVHDDELRRLYSHAACLIQPSLYEGFGYPPLEAMACGCPALCSEIPALRETCGDAAIFRNPRSPEDLADGIERATREGEAKKESIIRGFERAASFSRKRFEEGIRAVVWESLC